METGNLPIDASIVKKRMAIPKMIAELTYVDKENAIKYMQIWGEKKKTITDIYDELYSLTKESVVA
ncbi:hypothetical protein HCJ66_01200 [Listeria sp. FSL L7-1582]|uniref:hypothetical protein n=1 Tax=Listeria portnoyi TaxID=2713504 RepID=UPI00164E2A5D|nr:hypothetical protein [Listeria portnoyi]MBC6308159.1 hypothetical protein [Listeria portnoyi]